jgi:hypothetical protein
MPRSIPSADVSVHETAPPIIGRDPRWARSALAIRPSPNPGTIDAQSKDVLLKGNAMLIGRVTAAEAAVAPSGPP